MLSCCMCMYNLTAGCIPVSWAIHCTLYSTGCTPILCRDPGADVQQDVLCYLSAAAFTSEYWLTVCFCILGKIGILFNKSSESKISRIVIKDLSDSSSISRWPLWEELYQMCQGTPCNKSIFSNHIFESQRWALEAPKLSSKAMLLLVTRPSKTSSRKTLSERHIIVDNSNCVFCSTGREESAQLCVYVGEEKVEKHNIICIVTIIILPRWLICGGARAPHTLQTHWPPSSPGVKTLSKVDRYLVPPTV